MSEDERKSLLAALLAGASPPPAPINLLAGIFGGVPSKGWLAEPGAPSLLNKALGSALFATSPLNRLAAMPAHQHARHFSYFFSRLNPSPTYEARASSQYNTIKGLIENRAGPASVLSPTCFLQGSYRRETAIYTINDVDIVVLCQVLSHPPILGACRDNGF